jgi:hypothetical protein
MLFTYSSTKFPISLLQAPETLPLQSTSKSLYISYFNPGHTLSESFIYYIALIAEIISYTVIILIIINLIIDNLKCMYYLIDFVQGLFLVIFIGGSNIWVGIY